MKSNIPLGTDIPPTSFRNYAIWAWGKNTSPNVFLPIEFNITQTLEFLHAYNASNSASISFFQVFLKAMGLTINRHPQLNRTLVGKKIYQRRSIDFFVIKAKFLDNPLSHDLIGFKIGSPHTLKLSEFAELLGNPLRDTAHEESRFHRVCLTIAQHSPLFLTKIFLKVYDWLVYSLNLDPKIFGFPRDQFGSMWISNIGSLGLPPACVPHFPLSRCGFGASVGKIEKRAVVVDETIVAQDILPVIFSLDHRLYDAPHISEPINYLKELLSDPVGMFQ